MKQGLLRALACFAALLALAVPTAWGAAALKPCRIAGIRHEVQCGVVARPLNPARPEGVKIDVHYVVVPAMARRKWPDPVFLLAGGPGQSAIDVAGGVLPLFARLNNRRDIVFVDQRGTGRSAPLECEDERDLPLAQRADPELQLARLTRCRDTLQKMPHGDLRMFTTPIAMQDLDAVRAQLGAARINLVGVSYGTRAALDYQRQFPQHVRRSVLDGVAPPDMALPQSYATDGQAAFDAQLAACEAEVACARAHPRLRADWAALLAALPRSVTLAHPLTGEPERFTLTREMVLGAVRGPLYTPAAASALPFAIAAAARGRYEPLAGLAGLLGTRRGSALAAGLHFSVMCAEDYPRMAHDGGDTASDIGAEFARLYQRACAQWPRGAVPAAFYELAASDTPALLLSGGLDPVTPPRHGARVAQALGANAVHVVVDNAGHGVLGLGCMADVMFRFIDAAEPAQALAVDAACAQRIPRPSAYQPRVLPTTGRAP